MKVLALETATGAAGAAIASDDDGVLAELTVNTARHHIELLHPAIEEVCGVSGVALADIDCVAVDVGPGLFTGIRVGVSAAKAIAMALGIPSVAVTSLEAIRAAALDAGAPVEVVPVVDLRRGEVAWSYAAGMAWGPPSKLATEVGALDEGRVLFAGDGALRYRDVFETSEHPHWRIAGRSVAFPPVASVAVLALEAVREGRTLDPAHLAPCYLREADTRINWTTRHDGPAAEGR
ncbi:MAG: tRNA (adenosine(37)-N6)-threonylcarbamoyltransferase complex dimerization subunit type 1 TsaB [Acidimicrobiales bacterium]